MNQQSSSNNLLPFGDNLITSIIGEIFKNGKNTNRKQDSDDGFRQFLLVILVLALFLVVGSEPLKVVMRKNIGKKALSLLGIVVAFLLFLTWAGIMIAALIEMNKSTGFGFGDIINTYLLFLVNPYILCPAIAGYIIFSFYFLTRGVKNYFNTRKERSDDWITLHYRGNSLYMQHLIEQGWNQKKIWMNAEPKICFRISLFITIINPIIGFPLLLTSLSFWFNEWYHVDNDWENIEWNTSKTVVDTSGNITEQNFPVSTPSSFRIRTND